MDGAGQTVETGAGRFCLIPAQCEEIIVRAQASASFLEIT
jgi:hypothetical protein